MADEEKTGNTTKELMEAFGTKENPVSTSEFRIFWHSLTEAEKAEFRNAEL